MGTRAASLRAIAREMAILIGGTILGLAVASAVAVLIGTMPAFLALALRGGR